ncbi:MAG: SDR family oxidoreductase [Victivallales bacterium]|nr:SDR family oxidoreductase [Victivallales bacterium]
MKLTGKIAIVTGGSGYIGAAIVSKLTEEGANVVVFDLDPVAMEKQKESYAKQNMKIETFLVDICDYNQVKTAVAKVKNKFGRIDILVNNAGVSARSNARLFVDQNWKVFRQVVELNLFGTLHCMHVVLPGMIEADYGKIINIASLVGIKGVCRHMDYGAAKAGVINATQTLAMEVAGKHININCVSPGKVPRPGEVPADETAFVKRYTCSTRFCTGNDIAEMTVFLATDAADYICGQNFIVDGGRSLGLRGDY